MAEPIPSSENERIKRISEKPDDTPVYSMPKNLIKTVLITKFANKSTILEIIPLLVLSIV